jgi:flagellar protein FlaG
VQVSDKTTQELVRQIPSEEVLNIARTLEVLQGLLIRQRV